MKLATLSLSVVIMTLIVPLHGQEWTHNGLEDEVHRVAVAPDSSVILTSVGTNLLALNASDGTLRWSVPIDEHGARRTASRCFIGTTSFVQVMDGRVIGVAVSDGTVRTIAENFTGWVDSLHHQVMILKSEDQFLAIDARSLKEIYRRSETALKWYDPATEKYFVTAPHELTVIDTRTAEVNTYTIEPEETYRRVRDKIYTASGFVTLVAESGFYTYDVSSGRLASHVPHDPSSAENYQIDTIDAQPYLVISMDEQHEVYNLTNGKRFDVPTAQLPGIVDRLFGTRRGLGLVVSYDDDDSMHVGCLDVATGTLRWSRTVGWGNRTYKSDHLYYPSGFVAFLHSLNGGTNPSREAQRQVDMRAMTYNKSTGFMEPDYEKQMAAFSSGSADRAMQRTIRLMAEEARRPVPNLAEGIRPRWSYADANLVHVDDAQVTMLIYGAVFRPGEDADYPNGEGLMRFDVNTGNYTLDHIPLYGNEETAGDFSTTHMADVRDMGDGHFCVFADTAIVFVSKKGASRRGFKTKKVTMYTGTLDSMWVVDTDPETDLLNYYTLVYDRSSGTITTHLRAQSDIPCLIVDGWPTNDVAVSFVDDELKIYASAPSGVDQFTGALPVATYPEDTIQDHRYAELYDDEMRIPAYGVKVLDDHVVLIGRDATGFFSTSSSTCSTVLETSERTGKIRYALRQLPSGMLRETQEQLRVLQLGAPCAMSVATSLEIDDDHRTYPLRDGLLFVDNDAGSITFLR